MEKMKVGKCANPSCGKPFYITRKGKTCCSNACANAVWVKKNRKPKKGKS